MMRTPFLEQIYVGAGYQWAMEHCHGLSKWSRICGTWCIRMHGTAHLEGDTESSLVGPRPEYLHTILCSSHNWILHDEHGSICRGGCQGRYHHQWVKINSLYFHLFLFFPFAYRIIVVSAYAYLWSELCQSGVIPALLELLRGRSTWVEQRVAVRALGHLATYDSTFPAVAANRDILELAIQLAIDAVEIVYTHFLQFVDKRMSYHCDLLTRGMGGLEMESRKAEEWASQLQCWSLQLINCFAFKEEFLPTICHTDFLQQLPCMWGGLVNESSPAGVGVLRTICHQRLGRLKVAECPCIIEALCNIARSSDDWQYMAVDCLIWLLQDSNTRFKVKTLSVSTLCTANLYAIWWANRDMTPMGTLNWFEIPAVSDGLFCSFLLPISNLSIQSWKCSSWCQDNDCFCYKMWYPVWIVVCY